MTRYDRRLGRSKVWAMVGVTALVTLSVTPMTPAEASDRRALTVKVSSSAVSPRTTVVVSGRLSRSAIRTRIVVQRYIGRAWVDVRSTRTTSRAGAFKTSVIVDRTTWYRAVSPSTKHSPRSVSSRRRVVVKPIRPRPALPVPQEPSQHHPTVETPAPPEGRTVRISQGVGGARIDGYAESQSVSADGRFVAYESNASNIIATDGETGRSIYLWDRSTGTNDRISGYFDGFEFQDQSEYPEISSDGRFIAFASSTQGEALGQSDRWRQVFLWDASTRSTVRVSQSADGTAADGSSSAMSVSADGRYVVFASYASNLVPGDTNGSTDVFLWDRDTGVTRMASHAMDDNGSPVRSWYARGSDDGRYVAFESEATNDIDAGAPAASEVFVWDSHSGTTQRTPDAADSPSRVRATKG